MIIEIVKLFKKISAVIFFLTCFSSLFGQHNSFYYPFIKNFKRSEFRAGMQTWMISQAPNELMYFANDFGIMEFDGYKWNLYGIEKRTLYRSVYAAKDGRIYVGFVNDFGYLSVDSIGQMRFYSLKDLLPDSIKDVEDVWRIHKTNDGIIFQTYKYLIAIKDNKAKVYDAPSLFHFSFSINMKLYVVDHMNGLLEFSNGEFIPQKGTKILADKEVCAVLPTGGNLLIATLDHGVFSYNWEELKPWDNLSSEFLRENQIYCATRIDNERVAFGTIQNGVMICTNEGIPIYSINQSNGLQNNTILCMKIDRNGNLWMGTNNGIDLVYLNLPLNQLNQFPGIGAGYSAIIHNEFLYLGTNQGVFYKKRSQKNQSVQDLTGFKIIEATKGQVWSLKVIEGELFCGHNKGAFIIEGEKAKLICETNGVWAFLKTTDQSDKIIAGTYTGLILFEKKNGNWVYSKRIKGFSESSRVMVVDKDESIWMSHGFKGAFHIKLNEKMDSVSHVELYNSKKGFKTDYGINVAKLQKQVVFFSLNGAYVYNKEKDKMEPSEYYNNFFKTLKVNNVIEDSFDNIWYFSDNSFGVKQRKSDGTYKNISLPFKMLQGKFIDGFHFVYPIDKKNILIGYENGFIHYDPYFVKDYSRPFNVYIRQIKATNSNLDLFQGHLFTDNQLRKEIQYKDNRLHFFYSAINFENPDELEFSTCLIGYDKKWSSWEKRFDREFTNLKEGSYSFRVKARNIYNVESATLEYKFLILPPWYQTSTAYVFYIIIVLILAAVITIIVQRRISMLKIKEKEKERKKHIERERELQKEALIAEKEIIRLRNDRLRSEIRNKDKELANSTMQTIQKNKFLIGLKKDLRKSLSEEKNESIKANIKRLIRKIDSEIANEKNWEVFETYFGNVHEEFLNRIKKQYPQISPAELKLCAFLRMNISSKEIASLLNISVRGVEASRYRLRKALNLEREVNLTDFILSI